MIQEPAMQWSIQMFSMTAWAFELAAPRLFKSVTFNIKRLGLLGRCVPGMRGSVEKDVITSLASSVKAPLVVPSMHLLIHETQLFIIRWTSARTEKAAATNTDKSTRFKLRSSWSSVLLVALGHLLLLCRMSCLCAPWCFPTFSTPLKLPLPDWLTREGCFF